MSSQEIENVPRLVVIGDSGVGKTCLIDRFIGKDFNSNTQSSQEPNYVTKTIEIPEIGKSITINIWDTIGQEKYRSLTRLSYTDAKMAILVYDITHKKSFDEIKNWWYKDIKEHGDPNIIIGIAGNKSDRFIDQYVSEQEGRQFAESVGAAFRLTSAENCNGINELFKDVGRKYLELSNQNIESNQKIKIGEKDADKKKEKQKNKKKHCFK